MVMGMVEDVVGGAVEGAAEGAPPGGAAEGAVDGVPTSLSKRANKRDRDDLLLTEYEEAGLTRPVFAATRAAGMPVGTLDGCLVRARARRLQRFHQDQLVARATQ